MPSTRCVDILWIFCGLVNNIHWWMGKLSVDWWMSSMGWVDFLWIHKCHQLVWVDLMWIDGYHPLDGCVPCGLVNAIRWWMGELVFSY